ncbi:hypothetical protein MEG_01476 [Bartonella tamiae Th307]|uniref:DDE domain-containing protein n=1 Tax=Bartonella tamiae Th239 TaxID=1094558 RepID=J0ZQW7_9HYPH|nr:hypothetical protein ME5_00405 [Bartonella tamiae Th239]EJF93262.1 hypothetical protein MEG_01476 [Bartonella tamiae Th307]
MEKRLRNFRKPHCGSVRIDETYIKVKGQWKYLYRAIDKHGVSIDFLLTSSRDKGAAIRFFRKAFKDDRLFAPSKIGTDKARAFPGALQSLTEDNLLSKKHAHYATKILQQGIESDHSRLKRPMSRSGGFQSFRTAKRTISGYEAMLWLKKGFGSKGAWTIKEQNQLLRDIIGIKMVNNT